jgi:uncharacterized protein (TIGR02246 family)
MRRWALLDGLEPWRAGSALTSPAARSDQLPVRGKDDPMSNRLYWLLALGAATVCLGARPAWAAEDTANDKDKAAIAKNAEAFVEAFHNGDAKAVAAFWAPDGDYTDQTGRRLKGREAIEKAFKELFAENKGLKLRIDSASLRFLTADVAVEDGVTAVLSPDGGPPSRARYTTVHVKKDGQWLLGSVRDAPFAAPSNYEHLRQLEWAIGDWAAEGDNGETARASFSWADHQNFIVASFATTFKNITIGGGEQRIGWDPSSKQLRSWTFESSGGFAEATWTREGDNKWIINSRGVLQDGTKLIATHIITRVDADTFTWQSKERAADGKPLPDVKEIKMKRVK